MTPASHNPGSLTPQPLSHPDPATLQLITLGRVALIDGESSVLLGPGKPLALLTYLRSIPGQSASREHLLDLLWADSAPSLGRQALRQTLTRLRHTIGDGTVRTDGDDVSLATGIRQDREAFLSAIDSGDLPAAVTLYTGPFFPDFGTAGSIRFEQWADGERAHLLGLFTRAGESLARRHMVKEPREALRIARLLHGQEPESESIARLMLQAALAAGETVQAQSIADRLTSWLTDAGRTPEPATTRLIHLAREPVEVAEQPTGAARLTADLVGREREFAAVLAAWNTAQRDGAQVLHFEARPGYGKTRLLRDAAIRLRAMGVPVIQLRANQGEQEISYCLAADAVRATADLPGITGIDPVFAPALLGLHPPLINVFSGARPLQAGADLPRQRMLALGELLSSVADERPLALFVDDLHWADGLSRQVLSGAVNRLGQSPVLVVTAARPGEDRGPLVPDGSTTRLEPFSRADCASLVTSLATTPDADWTSRMGDTLWQASHGSPLLSMEALRLSVERGDLQIRNGSWYSEDFEGAMERVRAGDPLAARLDALGAEEHQVLLALSVAGSSLGSETLASCLEAPESLDPALAALETSGHIARSGGGWIVGHDEMGSAVLERFGAGEQAAMRQHLGRHLLSGAGNNIPQLKRAGQLLAAGGDHEHLPSALARLVRSARESGDSRPSARIIADTVRGSADSHRVKQLTRSLPIRLRLGIRPVHAAMAFGGVTAVLAVLALAPWGSDAPPPDASLLIVQSSDEDETVFASVPVWRAKWDHTVPITPESGDELTIATARPYNRVVAAPDGKRMAVTRLLTDSGLTDIYLREEDGSMRRVTSTRGDDVGPSWSPDGRFIVFSTVRWSPHGDDNFDLGVMNLSTGQVRRLTQGADTDTKPYWSPDGTRIAFSRERDTDGLHGICWITFDGGSHDCRYEAGAAYESIGWHGSDAILTLRHSYGNNIRRLDVMRTDGSGISTLHPRNVNHAIASTDGQWILAGERSMDDPSLRLIAFPTARPDLAREVLAEPTVLFGATWRPGVGDSPQFLDSLEFPMPVADPVVGVPYRVRVETLGRDGLPVEVGEGVMRWRASDPRIARIDSLTGLLEPLRKGQVTVRVTAGGWRSDSLTLRVTSSSLSVIDSVRWTEWEWPEWTRFGDPSPVLDTQATGEVVMMPNGDRTFESGVVSRRVYAVRGGLSVEALVSIPVSRTKWQNLRMDLSTPPDRGGHPMGCALGFPAGEGRQSVGRLHVTSPTGRQFPEFPGLGDGGWHTLGIEILPDGSCSYVVDGKSVDRSKTAFHVGDSVQITFAGHSVGTRIMVKEVNVWRGVRPQD